MRAWIAGGGGVAFRAALFTAVPDWHGCWANCVSAGSAQVWKVLSTGMEGQRLLGFGGDFTGSRGTWVQQLKDEHWLHEMRQRHLDKSTDYHVLCATAY